MRRRQLLTPRCREPWRHEPKRRGAERLTRSNARQYRGSLFPTMQILLESGCGRIASPGKAAARSIQIGDQRDYYG